MKAGLPIGLVWMFLASSISFGAKKPLPNPGSTTECLLDLQAPSRADGNYVLFAQVPMDEETQLAELRYQFTWIERFANGALPRKSKMTNPQYDGYGLEELIPEYVYQIAGLENKRQETLRKDLAFENAFGSLREFSKWLESNLAGHYRYYPETGLLEVTTPDRTLLSELVTKSEIKNYWLSPTPKEGEKILTLKSSLEDLSAVLNGIKTVTLREGHREDYTEYKNAVLEFGEGPSKVSVPIKIDFVDFGIFKDLSKPGNLVLEKLDPYSTYLKVFDYLKRSFYPDLTEKSKMTAIYFKRR